MLAWCGAGQYCSVECKAWKIQWELGYIEKVPMNGDFGESSFRSECSTISSLVILVCIDDQGSKKGIVSLFDEQVVWKGDNTQKLLDSEFIGA